MNTYRYSYIMMALSLPQSLCATPPPATVRFCTYNCSLNRTDTGAELDTLLANQASTKPKQVAEIIQRIRPDILLLNEFDYNPSNPSNARNVFQINFLSVSQNGQDPISYPYNYSAAVNTGVPSGFDLDRNGTVVTTPGTDSYGNDCKGFGRWP